MIPGASPLTELYARWMDEFLGAPLPVEARATCNDCRMAPPHSGACGGDIVFQGNTKCCTFMPELPNFLAGAVLSDDSIESSPGRALFERGAETRAAANPLGVFPPPEYAASYRYNYSNFTQRERLLCPYYMREEGGLCGIWRHRNGRCSTWFCKHERGSVGALFWSTLDRLLAAIEGSLAEWCLLKLDQAVLKNPQEWGAWAGLEREFYRECWRLVEPLTWVQVLEIVRPAERLLARDTADAFQKWRRHEIPERLQLGEVNVEPIDAARSRVWCYSVFDPLDLETRMIDALSLFDGSTTDATLDRIERERGIRLDRELLQKLCDFRILVESE